MLLQEQDRQSSLAMVPHRVPSTAVHTNSAEEGRHTGPGMGLRILPEPEGHTIPVHPHDRVPELAIHNSPVEECHTDPVKGNIVGLAVGRTALVPPGNRRSVGSLLRLLLVLLADNHAVEEDKVGSDGPEMAADKLLVDLHH